MLFAVDTLTWATVATAAFAAVAAGASWASVLQNRRMVRASLEPLFHVALECGKGAPRLGFHVRNSGGGTAKGIGFVMAVGDRGKAIGRLPIGFVQPGDGAHVVLNFSGEELVDGDVTLVVISQDVGEFVHAWAFDGRHKAFRNWRRRPREVDGKEVHEHFFGPTNWSERTSVPYRWEATGPDADRRRALGRVA
jgi:hypothetical protein